MKEEKKIETVKQEGANFKLLGVTPLDCKNIFIL
jgi:hypothetical protein